MIQNRLNKIISILIVCEILSVSCEGNFRRDLPSERRVHNCKLTNNEYTFNVLPGSGWDNLENRELGQVLKISYKRCSSSNDGSFLIPDETIIIPIKKSTVELSSDMFDHFANFTSATSKSINTDASYTGVARQISGSFSWENKNIKNNQIKEKSSVSRVQLRHELYTVTYEPDAMLDPKFKNRILDIGALLKDGKDTIYPHYLADLLIRDFGTHVIRSVDTGAILSKTDVLKSRYVKMFKGDTTKISAAASFSMTKIFSINIKGNYFSDIANLNEYNNNSASTKVETIGGTPFGSNFKLEDWEKSLDTNLVAIDRKGDPLFFVITPRSLPEFEDKIVYKIVSLIKEAVDRYYSANTRVGCMNMESENFNDDANVDSGACEPPKSSYTLGGTFQTCTGSKDQCKNIAEVNPVTNDYACPSSYETIELQSGLNKCEKKCIRATVFSYNCHYECSYYQLYWCVPTNKTSKSEGALFGGFYSNKYSNPITNSFSCPPNYLSSRFGMTAKICLSLYKQEGRDGSLPFGGFYSCKAGNPLSDRFVSDMSENPIYWPAGCSTGYSSHLAIVDRGCQISYCVKTNVLSIREQPPLFRPPFIDLGFGPNVTVISSLETPMGLKLFVDKSGHWSDDNRYNLSNYNIIIISFSVAAIVIITIIIVILGVHRYNRNRRIAVSPKYHEFDGNDSNSSIINPTISDRVQPFRIIVDEEQ